MVKSKLELLDFPNILDLYVSRRGDHDPADLVLVQQRIDSLIAMLKGEKPIDKSVLTGLDPYNVFNSFLQGIVFSSHEREVIVKEDNFIVQFLCNPQHISGHSLSNTLMGYVNTRMSKMPSEKNAAFLTFLKKQGFSDEDIMRCSLNSYGSMLLDIEEDIVVLTAMGEYIKTLLDSSNIKSNKYLEIFHEIALDNGRYSRNLKSLKYLLILNPEYVDERLEEYILVDAHMRVSGHRTQLNMEAVEALVETDAKKFAPEIIRLLEEDKHKTAHEYEVYARLHHSRVNDYSDKLLTIWESYKSEELALNQFTGGRRAYSEGTFSINKQKVTVSENAADLHFSESQKHGTDFLKSYLGEDLIIYPRMLSYIEDKLKEESVSYLIKALKQDTGLFYSYIKYTRSLFELLSKHNYDSHIETLIDYCINAKPSDLKVASEYLAQLDDKIVPYAKELLGGKTVSHRLAGALILSKIENADVQAHLNEATDKEKNDTTRNVMLDAIAQLRFAKPYSLPEARHMIALAEKRKKLAKWGEKFLDEDKLPTLYWNDDKELTQDEVRFLFYRMKQAKGLNSDIEARQVIKNIDASKSPKFALHLLTAFVESGSNTKLKHYLTLTGLLGGDEGLTKLNTLFKKCIADKRSKMAEYVLGAIAMIGSDKALRIIEVISRKYANKKPKLSEYAGQCLDAAATELGITKDQLADRIIPNFDFDGIFKEFDVEGETFRAFVNSDFRLIYYNEDNKSRKSVPPAASKEIKKEFKEIGKEINTISKSQSGRLEKYMVEDRKWPVEVWQEFFQSNPIMFVFAMKLLWSVFDKDGKFVEGFYCDEECALYNHEDEEIELEEGQKIGIMHPLDLTPETLKAWQDKIYEISMVTIFPTVDRQVFTKQKDELEKNHTKIFYKMDVPKGADFTASYLVKKGWVKSPSDGGSADFTKTLQTNLIAFPHIDGPTVYYQGGETKATVYEIYFRNKNSKEKLKIQDIPDKWYSEIIADIDSLIKAT